MTDLKQTDVAAVPRFANVATFMRSQLRDTPEGLDIAMFGVPLDLGSSFRSGARHGPAQVREMSRLIREVNYSTKIAPFDLCDIADIGDAPVNSLDMDASLRSIQHFVQTVLECGRPATGDRRRSHDQFADSPLDGGRRGACDHSGRCAFGYPGSDARQEVCEWDAISSRHRGGPDRSTQDRAGRGQGHVVQCGRVGLGAGAGNYDYRHG